MSGLLSPNQPKAACFSVVYIAHSNRFIYSYFFAAVLTISFLLLSFNLFALETGKGKPVYFRGAELYTQNTEDGNVTVFLKKYYDCNFDQQPETEHVSLFEIGTQANFPPLILKQVSRSEQENKYLQTPDNPNAGCLSVMLYSAAVPMGPGRAEYMLTWGYNITDNKFLNTASQGISLSVRVDKTELHEANTMTSLSSLPPFIMAVNKNVSNSISFQDMDGDKVSFALSTPFSLETVNKESTKITDGRILEAKEGTVLTGRWPFKEITYEYGYSSKKPISAGVFSIDENTGVLNYQPIGVMGKYLAAITITEKRNNNKISEHQCVFVIDVK